MGPAPRPDRHGPSPAPVDPAKLEADGWCALPGVLAPVAAEALAQRCIDLLGDDVAAGQGDKRTGATRRAGLLLERLPEVAALVAHPGLMAAVARLVAPPPPLADVSFRCPQPGFGAQSLHADDVPITRAGEQRAVTAIIALCDFTTSNGATAVVPGTHRRPDLQRRVRRLDLGHDEVGLTGAAGTAFVFSAHLLHRGTLNRSSRPRPALQVQWRPAPSGPSGGG